MMHNKSPFVKMADGKIVNFIESIKNRAIVEITPAERASLTMHPRTDVVQMADGTLVSELQTIIDSVGAGGGGNITIDNVIGLRDALDAKGDNLGLSDDKLALNSGSNELSNVPMITSPEIQLILNNLT